MSGTAERLPFWEHFKLAEEVSNLKCVVGVFPSYMGLGFPLASVVKLTGMYHFRPFPLISSEKMRVSET